MVKPLVARKISSKVKFFQVLLWKFPSLCSSWSLEKSKLLGLIEKSFLKLDVRLNLLDFGLPLLCKPPLFSSWSLHVLSFGIPSSFSSKLWFLIEKSLLKLPVRMYLIIKFRNQVQRIIRSTVGLKCLYRGGKIISSI